MAGQSALLIGATGQTGKHVLKELLSSSHFTRVGEYGRRVTEVKDLTTGQEKLEQKVVDFEKLEPGAWKDSKWDVVFITLGTSRAQAGSAEVFEKIDRDYVVNAAKAAKADGIQQRIVYVSSGGANSNSLFLYARSKGLTEEALASLKYSDTIIFRPGMLKGAHRPNLSLAENFAGKATGLLSKISPMFEIQISDLAKSLLVAGRLGSAALPAAAGASRAGTTHPFTIIENKGALALSKN